MYDHAHLTCTYKFTYMGNDIGMHEYLVLDI